MKTLKFVALLLLTLSFGNCNDTEGDRDSEQVLQGTWKMVKAYGGIAGTVYTIPEGNVTWTFDIQANTLTIVNNNTEVGFDGGLASGTYSYEIKSEGIAACTKTLFIDGNDYGCFSETSAGLTISQVYADGLIYEFVD